MSWASKCHYCLKVVHPNGSGAVIVDPWCARTRDHVRPFASGEKHESPMVTACRECNDLKGGTPYEVFMFWRTNNPKHSLIVERTAYRKFCFDLTRAGFRAAKELLAFKARQQAPNSDEPQMNRRRRAEAQKRAEGVVAEPPPREAKPYTLKDLRKAPRLAHDASTVREAERLRKEATLSAGRKADRAVIVRAQRALSNVDISY